MFNIPKIICFGYICIIQKEYVFKKESMGFMQTINEVAYYFDTAHKTI